MHLFFVFQTENLLQYPGIFVEVETTEETTVITLQMYQEGMALVRLVNNLNDSQPVFYHQRLVVIKER